MKKKMKYNNPLVIWYVSSFTQLSVSQFNNNYFTVTKYFLRLLPIHRHTQSNNIWCGYFSWLNFSLFFSILIRFYFFSSFALCFNQINFFSALNRVHEHRNRHFTEKQLLQQPAATPEREMMSQNFLYNHDIRRAKTQIIKIWSRFFFNFIFCFDVQCVSPELRIIQLILNEHETFPFEKLITKLTTIAIIVLHFFVFFMNSSKSYSLIVRKTVWSLRLL